jgi:surfeit locus 1 family protein
MLRRLVLPLVFGLAGGAVLIGLGVWQVQRLHWKEAVLADIDARIAAPPVAVPAAPDAVADRFLPVRAEGLFTGEGLDVLASVKQVGAGYRRIAVLETADGRRLLVDRGFVRDAPSLPPRATGPADVTGNLHWPDEVDGFTPDPDPVRGLWFARDLPAMAGALGTEPVLIVARAVAPPDPQVTPRPVDGAGIPNDHLGYAVTWFLLAVVWLGMTGLLAWRIWRRTA